MVGWARRGFEDQEIPVVPTSEEGGTRKGENGVEAQEELFLDKAARLEAFCTADMNRWISKIMTPGTKCGYLTSCLVDPLYQGRGVGSALIRWGTERAAREGVFC